MIERPLVDLLGTLVAIPSVNPRHTDDPSISGERQMAEFVGNWLARRGFAIAMWGDDPARPNLVATLGPETARRALLLESHFDTVGVAGMTRDPFRAVVEDGRLFARGACDTKGPLAAALLALEAALPDIRRSRLRVTVVGAMGEESGNEGAEWLVTQPVTAGQAIILEPTDLAIVHAHKGALWFDVEVRGRAGHGSDPAAGVNAVTGMCRLVEELLRQGGEDAAAFRDPLLGAPTVSIGSIRGGTAVNIVPDTCVISVDRRTVPGEEPEEILARVRTALERLRERGAILGFEIRVSKMGTAFHTAPDSGLVRGLAAGVEAGGRMPVVEGAAWYSDAGAFSRVCREVVVFGPGSIRQAHTADEHIGLDSLQMGCRILGHFLRRVAAETGS